jgi:hypothetical protein
MMVADAAKSSTAGAMTYLYAALGMAMLIPILASLEMAGKLLEQQGKLGPPKTVPDPLERALLFHLQDLRDNKGDARTDLLKKINSTTPYCDALKKWLVLKDPTLENKIAFLKEQPLGCPAEVDGKKIIITGSPHAFNQPPPPLQQFSLLACSIKDRSSCAFEVDPATREGT